MQLLMHFSTCSGNKKHKEPGQQIIPGESSFPMSFPAGVAVLDLRQGDHLQCHQQQCVEGRWSGSHQQHHWRAERTGAVFGMSCLSTGCDQDGAQLCSCSEDVSSWGSQAGCGRDRGLD